MRQSPDDRRALNITLIYLTVGALWIFFSDLLLLRLIDLTDPGASLSTYQTAKGWFYVLITGALLYALSRQALRSQANALHRLYQTETDLQSTRQYINHLLASSPTVLYALKLEGPDRVPVPVWVSDSITSIMGYQPAEVLQPDWWLNNIDPRDRERGMAQSEALINTGSADHEYRFRDAHGNIRWIRDTAKVIYDDHGNPAEVIGSWTEVSARHEQDAQQRLYATAFEHINEGILVADQAETISFVNPAACQLFGYASEELIGQRLSLLASGRHDSWFFTSMKQTLQNTGQWQGEIWNRCKNGEIKPLLLSIGTIKNESDGLEKYVAVYTDISELKATEAQLHHLAYHDVLTGLPNRVLLTERLHHHAHQKGGDHGHFALYYLDLDDFKNVNDSLGHSIGDELLIAVAARLTTCLRPGETLARLGGDEFALIAQPVADAETSSALAAQIFNSLRSPFMLSNGRQLYVEACMGIALFPIDGNDEETLMRNADTAMYRAKRLGRNRHCHYEPQMSLAAVARLNMETELRQSFERGELELHYQPKTDAAAGQLRGAEALMRWRRQDDSFTPPSSFIPLAENSGLIIPLGDWVIQTACQQIRAWLDQELNPVSVAVNVSVRQFKGREQQLEKLIREALQSYAIPPAMLCLEITETAMMETPDTTIETLRSLKELGVTIALDDFGTGFSNMMHLSRMPLDYLKIDTSFTREITHPTGQRMVKSVIELGHSLQLKSIAEGVETSAQLECLRQLGCDEIQGYHISKPLPSGDYTNWLRNHDLVEQDSIGPGDSQH